MNLPAPAEGVVLPPRLSAPGVRWVDWDLPDPAGQSIDGVREIRDEIARRTEQLVVELGREHLRPAGLSFDARFAEDDLSVSVFTKPFSVLAGRPAVSGPRTGVRACSPGAVLVVLLTAGTALRLWLILGAGPGFLGYPDAGTYVQTASLSGTPVLFSNPLRPAGYPIVLGVLHGIVPSLTFATVVQHVMGLLIAGVLYRVVADVARHRWVALLPAAVVLFAGTELYLEHSALSETLYTALIVAALWCAVRSLASDGAREAAWLCLAGVLAGLSVSVRAIGVSLLPVLLIWVLATRRRWARRTRCATFLVLGLALPLGSYLGIQHRVTGTWGLTRTTGDTLYARSAVFADCHQFTPPAGTAALCPRTRGSRPGPTWYMYSPGSPAVRTFGSPPTRPQPGVSLAWKPDAQLGRFAVAAITHQPDDFLATTVQGLVSYVKPGFGQPAMTEFSATALIHALHDRTVAQQAVHQISGYDRDARAPTPKSLNVLDQVATVLRVEGPVTALLLLLTLGCLGLRGRRGRVAGLFGATTAVSMIAPVLLLFYGARYATPAYGLLAVTAALGCDGLLDRRSRRTRVTHTPYDG